MPVRENLFLMDDLGAKLPNHFDLLKKVTPRLEGCMSEVYLVNRPKPGAADIVQFAADANAEIVRGLIAILLRLYSGRRPDEILSFDAKAAFEQLGLTGAVRFQQHRTAAPFPAKIHGFHVYFSRFRATSAVCRRARCAFVTTKAQRAGIGGERHVRANE